MRKQLGPRIRYYDTSQSVQNLESVLESLKLGKIDLYGDSYGSVVCGSGVRPSLPLAAALADPRQHLPASGLGSGLR